MDAAFWYLLIAVFAPVTTGLMTLFLPRRMLAARTLLAAAGPAVSFCLVLAAMPAQVADNHAPAGEVAWVNALNLNLSFLVDGLGGFFALLIAGIGVMIVLYARGYFGRNETDLYRFFPTLGFFTTAMIGIVLADHMLLTLLFWEMTSISSFLLIGWDRDDKRAVKLAMQAFMTTGIGGMAMLGGIVLFGGETGIWRWSEFATITRMDFTQPPLLWAFVLLFIGAASKSAQVPFHFWLPGAMAAPTPVSAFLHSATMVKAGVFLVGRLFPVMAAMHAWPYIVVPIGAATMLLGAAIAINKHDLKQIFAYTTVSQLGLFICMYGLGSVHYTHDGHAVAAIDFDITQIANHALYKAPLFIAAGAFGHYVSRNITELHGAFWKHKGIGLTMLLAAWGLAALPGSISFQAKELFIYGVHHAAEVNPWVWVVMVMTVLTAIINVAIATRLFTTLLGLPGSMQAQADREKHDDAHEHEHGLWAHMIWLPGFVLVALGIIGGIVTPLWNYFFMPLETNINYAGFHGHVPALWQIHLGLPLAMSAVAIVFGIGLGMSRLCRGSIVDVFDRAYPASERLAAHGGGALFGLLQTGNLRHYAVFVLVAFLIGFIGSVAFDPQMIGVARDAMPSVMEFWPGILLGVIICATAVALPMTQSRFVRVLLLGACGFSVVGMYLLYQAPDLALTQLMFEIISVILFVIVLRLLPRSEKPRHPVRWRRLVLGAAAGIAFGWMTIVAATPDPARTGLAQVDRLGNFFAHHSHAGTDVTLGRGGGGDNIVNVILVDFRGFDTLGEITVLAVAALGVWSLIAARPRIKPA